MKRSRHRRFQAARKAADSRLHGLPNVVGTCYGRKVTDGKRMPQPCVTVFVERKVHRDDLPARHHVPKEVQRHGRVLATDVVEIGRIRRQARSYPISSGGIVGTVGAWGRTGASSYGITCAHCLPPPGNNVTGEFPSPGNFKVFGQPGQRYEDPGTGIFPTYGEIDAGLINLTPVMQAAVNGRPAQTVFRPPTSDPTQLSNLLQALPVEGWGGATGGLIRGSVFGVMAQIYGEYFDLAFSKPGGGGLTIGGDSGMLWCAKAGQALALHQAGTDEPDGSIWAFGCFAFRVADQFGLEFRQA